MSPKAHLIISLASFLLAALVFGVGIKQIYIYQNDFFLKNQPYYQSPLPTQVLFIRSDAYGKGYFGASRNKGRIHEGLDLASQIGTSVLAAKSGRVTAANNEKGYGQYIELVHPDGLVTRYAHLSAIRVLVGQWVAQGTPIGLSGRTGNANDPKILPHLHFELRDPSQNKAINPTTFFKPSVRITSYTS